MSDFILKKLVMPCICIALFLGALSWVMVFGGFETLFGVSVDAVILVSFLALTLATFAFAIAMIIAVVKKFFGKN